MAEDQQRAASLWPEFGKASISDSEILADMVTRLEEGELKSLTADSIYTTYVEAKKAADQWINYYLVSVALLILAVLRVVNELSLFGTKITTHFVGPVAILSFSVCTLVYTNHELKMRMYRAYFSKLLRAMSGPNRAQILLRYPLAFYGGEYMPQAARPLGVVIGWKQVLSSLPIASSAKLASLMSVFGLMFLVFYALYLMYLDPQISALIKGAVFAFFLGSMTFSGHMLRNPQKKHQYEV